jgi:hypothetical protein
LNLHNCMAAICNAIWKQGVTSVVRQLDSKTKHKIKEQLGSVDTILSSEIKEEGLKSGIETIICWF